MSRKTKTEHTSELIAAATTGYCYEEFASPKLYRAAKADRGHARMTAAEYAQHRMDRGQMPTCRIEATIERLARIHRQQRIIGGRRITGLTPGTKRPVCWAR